MLFDINMIIPVNKKVIVGFSGGVDSAVSMLLLKDQGADVEALHMTNWDDDGYCDAAKDLQDATKVCNQLSIPLHHVNFAKEYKENVFQYFLDEHKLGRTPNPDIICNREIKFGVFKKYAERLGAEYIATGHYAKLRENNKVLELTKPRDKKKDQTYFLHAVKSKNFENTLFPLEDLTKNEVRNIAKENGLFNHKKKDSTGICFIGERPFREFLKNYFPMNPGPIVDLEKNVMGTHEGLVFHTIGQRHGLKIGGKKYGSGKPWYVVEKKMNENTLVVVQGDHQNLYCNKIIVSNVSWINSSPFCEIGIKGTLKCSVKIRYRQADQACILKKLNKENIQIQFDQPQRAVALGQSAVLYDNDKCLGGGFIEEIIK